MPETEFYTTTIHILDNLLQESIELELVENTENWREQNIYKQFKQAKHIIFCLLSNTEGSKHQNKYASYVTELILVGSLGRIVRDNYVNIAYLTTNRFSIEEMQFCWEYQIEFKKATLFEFVNKVGFEDFFTKTEINKTELKAKLDKLNFSTRGKVYQGLDGKLLSIEEIANEKCFHKDKFKKDFELFSQFVHATPFANNLTTINGIDLGLLAAIYNMIIPYYIGIVTETLEILKPNHKRIDEFRTHYKKFRDGRWGVVKSRS